MSSETLNELHFCNGQPVNNSLSSDLEFAVIAVNNLSSSDNIFETCHFSNTMLNHSRLITNLNFISNVTVLLFNQIQQKIICPLLRIPTRNLDSLYVMFRHVSPGARNAVHGMVLALNHCCSFYVPAGVSALA